MRRILAAIGRVTTGMAASAPEAAAEQTAFQGHVDSVSGKAVRGWAWDALHPDRALRLDILADGEPIGETIADQHREDLRHAGVGDGRHAFEHPIPDAHWGRSIRVRVAGSTFFLIDDTTLREKMFFDEFLQSTVRGLPETATAFTSVQVGPDDRAVAAEIIAAWDARRALSASAFVGEGNMWAIHRDARQGEVLRLLEAGDAEGLAALLVGLPERDLSHGFLQGATLSQALRATTAAGRSQSGATHRDAIVSLAQSVGAARLESPEQGDAGHALSGDPAALLAQTERALGFPLRPPTLFGGLFGVDVGGAVYCRRHVQAIAAAARVREALRDAPQPWRIAEIGAGAGFSAVYALRAGAAHVTLFDLPVIGLVQYFTLRRAEPQRRVAFAGAPGWEAAEVVIAPAARFGDPALGRFDVVLNVDSMPEMGDAVCTAYLDALPALTPRFLSINQEAARPLTEDAAGPSQSVVSALLAHRPAYRRLMRERCWVRKGYAVELYAVAPPV